MTVYISGEDISARTGKIKLDALCANSGKVSAEVLAEAAENASSLIDSFAGSHYETPLSSVPPSVRKWAVDIAEYELYKLSSSPSIPEKVLQSYKDTFRCLEMLAEGKILLDGGAVKQKNTSPFKLTSSDSVMDAGSMKGF